MLCTFISPFRADRELARSLLPAGRFIEIYVKCDLEVCIQRDPKGLYAKAHRGEIAEFTGVSSPYEEPQHAGVGRRDCRRRQPKQSWIRSSPSLMAIAPSSQERERHLEANKVMAQNAAQTQLRHRLTGTVYLVGAGPGDAELITVKGLNLLRCAGAVVYDALVNPALLDEAPLTAERIYAGKRAGNHAMRQEEINEVLRRKAYEHAVVVRLKGGDPFVFGRGGEEMAYLREAGVPVEVGTGHLRVRSVQRRPRACP